MKITKRNPTVAEVVVVDKKERRKYESLRELIRKIYAPKAISKNNNACWIKK